jgi:hypothetical protein
MKTYILLILFMIVGISYSSFSQIDPNNNPFKNIEIGSNKYYSIQMKGGFSHHARIVSVDNEQTLLMNSDGNTFTVATNQILGIVEKTFESKGSVGVGFGIPYGIFGFNVDFRLYKFLYISGGLGTGIFITPMYNIGCKVYLRSGNYTWRPRLSVNYGTNGMLYVEDSYSGAIKESFSGITLGIGQLWTLGITKAWGVDFDILYIVNDSELETRLKQLKNAGYSFQTEAVGNVKVSLGLRYCF